MKKSFWLAAMVLLTAMGTARADNDIINEPVAAPADDSVQARKGLAAGSWTTTSTPALKVDENYYSNWAATGVSQVSFIGTFNGDYKYTHPKFIWDNVVDLALGVNWQDLVDNDSSSFFETRRKNDDKIDLTSTFSMKLKNAWNVNASANFKSQFMDGFKYASPEDEGTLVSSFMAPGYLTTAIGFECKKEFWNVSLSFLTGKTTFLLDEDVVNAGQLYGVDTSNGKRVYAGLGSYVKFYFKKDIAKNLNFYTRLELFYDYRKPWYHDHVTMGNFGAWEDDTWRKKDDGGTKSGFSRTGYCVRYDTDVDLEFKLEYRFSSFLAAYLASRFKYDSDFDGSARFFFDPNSPMQFFQSAGLQIYFNWKTPKAPKE